MNDVIKRLTEIATTDLTDSNAAIVLFALTQNDSSFNGLYRQVMGMSLSWITNKPLREVALRLLVIKIHRPSDFNGQVTGLFINRLIKSEVDIGGPYRDGQPTDILTNAAIAQILYSIGVKIPKLTTFLENKADIELSPLEECLLRWPHQLLSTAKDLKRHVPQNNSIEGLVAYKCLSLDKTPTVVGRVLNLVSDQVEKELLDLQEPSRSLAIEMKRIVDNADKNNEISFISQYFWDSLLQKQRDVGSLTFDFGVANFYAWIAYSIYDDFIDDEGSPKLLSVANIAHRRSLLKYLNASKGLYSDFILNVYDTVDSTNAWEVENCRFHVKNQKIEIARIPDYKNGELLADRALGHILGPLLLIYEIDGLTVVQRKKLEKGMRHYLIARQLNDDIHDWKEDIRNGHISFIIAHLLKASGIKLGVYDINKLILSLERYFWEQGLAQTLQTIMNHLSQASMNLEESKIFKKNNPILTNLIEPIRTMAEEGLITQNNHKDFLKTYI